MDDPSWKSIANLPAQNRHSQAHALDQVTWQQEIRNPLFDSILMPTVSTDQLPLTHRSLQKKVIQVLQHLLICLQLLRRRRLIRQCGESKLCAGEKKDLTVS